MIPPFPETQAAGGLPHGQQNFLQILIKASLCQRGAVQLHPDLVAVHVLFAAAFEKGMDAVELLGGGIGLVLDLPQLREIDVPESLQSNYSFLPSD